MQADLVVYGFRLAVYNWPIWVASFLSPFHPQAEADPVCETVQVLLPGTVDSGQWTMPKISVTTYKEFVLQ